jgi:release factor glutamine methyltransferase
VFRLYQPSEDSFLLAQSIEDYHGTLALEIGVGSGEVLKVLCQNFRNVIGTDLDQTSLDYCRKTLPSNVALVCCHAAYSLRARFDLIASNPPYLPIQNGEELDCTIHGGKTGIETTLRFLESAKVLLAENGRMLIVASSLSDYQNLLCRINQLGFRSHVLRKQKLFFETLVILEITL